MRLAWAIYASLPDEPAPFTLWVLDCSPDRGVPLERGEATFHPDLDAARAAVRAAEARATSHPPDPEADGPNLLEIWYVDPIPPAKEPAP